MTKIREELGVDVPHRPKRPRKSKEVSQSTPSAQPTTNESDTTTKVASALSTQHAPIETTSLLSNECEKHFCTYCFYNFFQGIAPLSVMSRHLMRARLHHYSHQKTMAVRQLHAMHCQCLLVLMPQPRNPLPMSTQLHVLTQAVYQCSLVVQVIHMKARQHETLSQVPSSIKYIVKISRGVAAAAQNAATKKGRCSDTCKYAEADLLTCSMCSGKHHHICDGETIARNDCKKCSSNSNEHAYLKHTVK